MRYFTFGRSLVLVLLTALPGSIAPGETAAKAGVAARADAKQLDFGIVQKLGDFVPRDAVFTDSAGKTVRLGDLLGKPTILALVYYKCAQVCNPLMAELSVIVTELPEVPGIDYQILTIGFDAREKPGDAAAMKANLFQSMALNGKQVDPAAWQFLTGDQENIDKLTNAVGFRFSKVSDTEFLHPTNLAILSPEGKVCRYMEGFGFVTADFRLSLQYARNGELASERLATPRMMGQFSGRDQLRSLCYRIDPNTGEQVLNVTRIVGAAMLLSALCMMLIITWASKSADRKVRKLTVNGKTVSGER